MTKLQNGAACVKGGNMRKGNEEICQSVFFDVLVQKLNVYVAQNCLCTKITPIINQLNNHQSINLQLSVFSLIACYEENFHKHKYQITLDTGI